MSLCVGDIYQMLYWYNWFSWWWAWGCSNHVENWNKHIEKNCASSWSFTKKPWSIYKTTLHPLPADHYLNTILFATSLSYPTQSPYIVLKVNPNYIMDSVYQQFRGIYSVFLWNIGMNILDYRCNIMKDHNMNMVCEIQGSHSWDVTACSLTDICCCQGRQGQHIPHKMSALFLQNYLQSHFKWQWYSRIHSILFISILTFVLPLALLYAWIRFTTAWDVSFI